mgnify:CR=1 FL=1
MPGPPRTMSTTTAGSSSAARYEMPSCLRLIPGLLDEVIARADFVTARDGGRGAVREVADMILKAQGKWKEAMKRYLEDEAD